MNKKLANKIFVLLITTLISIAVLSSCDNDAIPDRQKQTPDNYELEQTPDNHEQEQTPEGSNNIAEAVDIGTGSTVFTFEVTDNTGTKKTWNVHTDEATVGAALLNVELISGDDTDFGLMVIYVDGLRADFNEDGAYWAFYIGSEMAMEGVDTTKIEQGKVYAFIYTAA